MHKGTYGKLLFARATGKMKSIGGLIFVKDFIERTRLVLSFLIDNLKSFQVLYFDFPAFQLDDIFFIKLR